jgi:phage gp29-like protein
MVMKAFKEKTLSDEIAGVSAVRSAWGYDSVAGGLTPSKLAGVIRDANAGNLTAYLTLAEEMEERDPHYSSVMRTRRLAVTGITPEVTPASEDTKDVELAAEISELVKASGFDDLLADLLDAIGKGYSVGEIMWSKGKKWIPEKYIWRDPRFFQPHPDRPDELRIIDESDQKNGLEMPLYKFITHKPKLKSGLAMRGGLARLVALSYVCKMYGLKDWMGFLEVYGKPIRIGRYGKNASPADKTALKSALTSLGNNAAAILPEELSIELTEAVKGMSGGNIAYEKLTDWIDRQVSKAVLGQTMTTDDGSSKSQAEVHDSVRSDLTEADGKQLASTLNRDLVKAYIDINYGPQEHYPKIVIRLPEREDLEALSEGLSKFPGLKVSASQVREKFGVDAPIDDDDLLTIGGGSNNPFSQGRTAQNHPSSGCPGCGKAINRADNQADDIDQVVNDLSEDWQRVMNPALDAVRKAVNQAESFDELNRLLAEIPDDISVAALNQTLAIGSLKQHGDALNDAD